MNTQEALILLDKLIFSKTGQHLSDLQRLILYDCWINPRNSYEQIADRHGYSAKYLKQDAGPKLWKLISQVCEEKVKKTNFKAILERHINQNNFVTSPVTTNCLTLEASVDADIPVKKETNHTSQTVDSVVLSIPIQKAIVSWGEAPDISTFYGRDRELIQLEKWLIQDSCRLVTLLGMGGMGKTHLAVKLAHRVQEKFAYIYWKSLTYVPSVQQTIGDLLEFLAQGNKRDLPLSVEEQFCELVIYLKQNKCLIILDNLETVLESKNENIKYQQLLKLLGECYHQSCIILTSREKPQAISLMEGNTLPVRCWQLSGLTPSAARELLRLKGCDSQCDSDYNILVEKYSGNPLALKIVCATIQELFAGNIKAFLNQNTLVFSEIFYLLEQQFNRLSERGKSFLYCLAIAHEPISSLKLQQDIYPPISNKELIETLKVLAQHSLIEARNNKFSLQPVVQEYLTEKIIEQVIQEIINQKINLLKTHALLQVQAEEFIQEKQLEFIIKPLIDRGIKSLGNEQNLAEKCQQIIAQLQHQDVSDIGYSAGSILNILCQIDNNLVRKDLSNLVIWQADFQNVDLHNVNLTNSNLEKSVFAQQLTNILSVAFSHDGHILATGDSNGEICFWSVEGRKLLKTYREHAGWVFSLAFSPDGRMLASASSDGSIKLWDLERNLCLHTLLGHHQRVRCVVFHPQGYSLASASSDHTIKLWDVSTGRCWQTLVGHKNYVWSVVFSPDGKMLASGSEDKTIKLWNLTTGKCTHTLKGHTSWIRTIVFSPIPQPPLIRGVF
ncbi:MAG: hypothetical protein Tsb0014_14200 [Pleurocapsa sp.]